MSERTIITPASARKMQNAQGEVVGGGATPLAFQNVDDVYDVKPEAAPEKAEACDRKPDGGPLLGFVGRTRPLVYVNAWDVITIEDEPGRGEAYCRIVMEHKGAKHVAVVCGRASAVAARFNRWIVEHGGKENRDAAA